MYRKTDSSNAMIVTGVGEMINSRKERDNTTYRIEGENIFYFKDGKVYTEMEFNEAFPLVELVPIAKGGELNGRAIK